MKQISLTSLSLTNFRSFITLTTINFSTGPGLKLITGNNQAEPRLGANGCGKSTIWDAVCFALYGTSVKGLRPSDLITAGQQTVSASLEFWIDGKCHTVSRTAPPMRLYLDGQPMEQDAVDRLIGLSKARFLNSVVFGQAVPLFIDLPVPARGDLLDEVLDLELWLRAAGAAGDRLRERNNLLVEIRRAIDRTAGRIDGLGDPARFADQRDDWQRNRTARLDAVIKAVEELEGKHAELAAQSKALRLVDETENKQRLDRFQAQHTAARERLAAVNAELHELDERIRFMEDTPNCPTCLQPITTEHLMAHNERIRPHYNELEKKRDTAALDISTTRDELTACEVTWRALVRDNQEKRSTQSLVQRRMDDATREIDRLVQDAERLAGETDPYAAEAERVRQELVQLRETLERQQGEEAVMVSQTAALEYWRQGFRKVRLYCLEQVLRELTLETRNSLTALGLHGWSIEFTTATETRSGTVKLGVQVDVQAPAAARRFEQMSGGESQRARLAVSLGLANLIQRWAGVRFDLEVFDEPTAWLSEQGVEDLLQSLHARAANRSIWVCDHRALIYAGFSEVVNIVKTEAGSRIATAV